MSRGCALTGPNSCGSGQVCNGQIWQLGLGVSQVLLDGKVMGGN